MSPSYSAPISEFVFGDLRTLHMTPTRLTEVDSWHEHIPFAFWITNKLAPSVFVELGVRNGDSYFAFCQAVEKLALNTACYGVIAQKGETRPTLFNDLVLQEFCDYHDRHYASFSRLIHTTFDDALRYFPDGSIDLLHLDGPPDYEDMKHNFKSWLPKLSSQAVVLFHAINVREQGFGVWKLFHELSEQYSGKTFSFMHGSGLGVLAIGNEAPDAIKYLCSLTDEDATYVRFAFSNIGKYVKTKTTDCSREEKPTHLDSINKYCEQVDALNQAILDRDEQIAGLSLRLRKTEIDGFKAQFRLASQLRQKDQGIAEKVQVIAEKEQVIAEKDQVIAEKDKVIAEKNQLITKKDQVIALLYNSRSMKLTKPLRMILQLGRRIQRAVSISGIAIKSSGGLLKAVRKAIRLYQMSGLEGIKRGFRSVEESKQQLGRVK